MLSTSGVSSSSRFCSLVRYGAQPAASASTDGSVILSTVSITCQASRFCRMAITSDLYSAASSFGAVGGRLVGDEFGLDPERGARVR